MTTDTVGGVWTYALDLCRVLQHYQIEVCLATLGAPLSLSQREEAKSIHNLELRESVYKLEWMDDPWDDIQSAGEWLLDLEMEIQPDIIHLNNFAQAHLPWQAPVLVVAHSCVLSWWEAVKKENVPPELNEYKKLVKIGLQAADVVIAVSRNYAKELNRIYGPLKNLTVIYNGGNATSFDIRVKKFQVFAMGRIWDEAKNLKILSIIAKEYEFPILLAGDNRLQKGLPVEISDVQFLGLLSHSETKQYLSESYVFVLPAKYEPFGLSALEAALSGCLLVLSDIPTLREIWQESALYFDPDQPQELLNILNRIVQYPEMSKDLINRSLKQAQQFSLNKMGRKYLSIYQSLCFNHSYKLT